MENNENKKPNNQNNNPLNKLLVIDEVLILRYLDTVYTVGIGLIIVAFLICAFINVLSGSFFTVFLNIIVTAIAFIAWRIICEVLFCVAPDDYR